MNDDLFLKGLQQADSWMEAVVRSLSPARRKALLGSIARDIRKSNQKRVTKQVGPDGDTWPSRKRIRKRTSSGQTSSGQVRKKARMMLGLRQARRMKISATDRSLEVGFSGRNARIAAVHHFGGVEVDPQSGVRISYPVRQLLGFSEEDREMVRQKIFEHIEGKR